MQTMQCKHLPQLLVSQGHLHKKCGIRENPVSLGEEIHPTVQFTPEFV